jgi:hypothetical protein
MCVIIFFCSVSTFAGNGAKRGAKLKTHIDDAVRCLFLLQSINAFHEVRGILIVVLDDRHAL